MTTDTPAPATLLDVLAALPGPTRLYAQRQTDTGLMGASLGSYDVTPQTSPDELEAAIVRRAGGPVVACVRTSAQGKFTRIEIEAGLAAYYLSQPTTTPTTPTAPTPSSMSDLQAKLDDTLRQLAEARTPTTTSLVNSDPMAIGMQLAAMQDKAFERALTLLSTLQRPTAPSPTPTSTDYSAGMQMGKELATLAARAEAVSKGKSTDWLAVATMASPVVERLLGTLDKLADARVAESEAKLAKALPEGAAQLSLVPAPAPAPAPAAVVADEVVEAHAAE